MLPLVTSPNPPPTLAEELSSLFQRGTHQRFEDGIESDFAIDLQRIVRVSGSQAIVELSRLILTPSTSLEVAAEALKWLGRLDDPSTRSPRRRLLESGLGHPSPMLRDGAILGLSFLDDPASISALQAALRDESVPELKADISQVLQQWQSP
jgi:HEAT repeat protein